MSEQDKLPGVTFHVITTETMGTTKGVHQVVKVTLRAEINDETVWAAAHAKLKEGLKVYTADDFKTEMMNALREENEGLEAELKRTKLRLETVEEENKNYRAALSVVHRQLEG